MLPCPKKRIRLAASSPRGHPSRQMSKSNELRTSSIPAPALQSAPKEHPEGVDARSGILPRKQPTTQTKRPKWVQFASPYNDPASVCPTTRPQAYLEASTSRAILLSKNAHLARHRSSCGKKRRAGCSQTPLPWPIRAPGNVPEFYVEVTALLKGRRHPNWSCSSPAAVAR